MKGYKHRSARTGGMWLQRVVVALITVLGSSVLGAAAAAYVWRAKVRILPEHPTEGETVVLIVSGPWGDSCLPKLAEVRISRKQVVIATESLVPGRTPGQRSWSLFVPVGKLPLGPYAVTGTHRRTGLPSEMPEQMPGCSLGNSLLRVSQEDLRALVQGNTAFALDLCRVLQADKALAGKNLFFSPYDISLALAMAYAGTRGRRNAR